MKALILAGGRGSRLQELTDNRNKCMYEFRGLPLIEYSLGYAVSAGVKEIIIVVSYRAESIINAIGTNYKGLPVKYVIQWERNGLVHAIESSAETIDGDDFLLFLGDEVLVNPRHTEMITRFEDKDIFGLCGVIEVDDIALIRKTYAVIYNEQTERIYRLIEKPRKPLNRLMGTGNCVFKNEILDYIQYTPINQQRGEKELPDLIQCALDDGQEIMIFGIGEQYLNINTHDDIENLESTWPDS